MTSSADRLPPRTLYQDSWREQNFSRRELLLGAGTASLAALASRRGHAQAAAPSPPITPFELHPSRWK
jgi:hypothetical protein